MSLSSSESAWLENLVLSELKLGHKLRDIVPRTDEGFSNENYEVHTDWGGCFCKLNREFNLFDSEAFALTLLHKTASQIESQGALRVPIVKGRGVLPVNVFPHAGSYMVLEHVYMREISGHPKDQAALGTAIAQLHSVTGAPEQKFGFEVPTYLGGLRLDNEWHDDWWHFFTHRRLAPLFRIAGERQRDRQISSLWRRLLIAIPRLFVEPADAARIVPSLLHGDLTPLNASSHELKLGKWAPCIFDPASFYGHAEFDLALSRLDGMEQYQFHPSFYESYHAVRPKGPGFDLREKIYVLYHALNHHNVYGSAYGDFKGQVMRLGEELLSALPEPVADPGPKEGDAELEWDRIEQELERKQREAEAKHVPEFGEAFKTVEEAKPKGKVRYDDSDESSESKPETALPKFVAPVVPRVTELRERSANADDSSSSDSEDETLAKKSVSPPPAVEAPAVAVDSNAFASIFAAVDEDGEPDTNAPLLSPKSPTSSLKDSHKSPRHSSSGKMKKSGKTKTKTDREEIKTEVDLEAELSPRKARKSSGAGAADEDLLSPRSREKRRHHKKSGEREK